MVFRYNFRRRFEASHRLWLSKGDACNNLHGHSFHVNIILLEDLHNLKPKPKGYSFPFADIKKRFWKFVDEELDHSAFLNKADPLAKTLYKCTANAKVVLFRSDPTTEEIAQHLLFKFLFLTPEVKKKKSPITSIGIKIEETETNHVDFYLGEGLLRDMRQLDPIDFEKHGLDSFPDWVFKS